MLTECHLEFYSQLVTDMLSVSQLEERLRPGLGLLSRPRPGTRRGQRTLNSAMNVAWDNLSLEQRSLFLGSVPFSKRRLVLRM